MEIKTKMASKKKSDEGSVEKLNQGKKTFKTIFKGSSGRQVEVTNLTNSIAKVSF